MKFLTKSLWILLLLFENCSGCSNEKPTSSQQQPTPIQGIPDIPPAPPIDESPSTQPPKPNPDNPEKPISPDEKPNEDDDICSIIITYVDKTQQGYIEDDIQWFTEFFKNKDINLSITKSNNQIILHISKSDALKLKDLSFMFCLMKYIQAINFVKFPKLYPTQTQDMFAGNCDLTELRLPEMDYSNIENFRAMFSYCYKLNLEGTNLTKQDISAFDNRLAQLQPSGKNWSF